MSAHVTHPRTGYYRYTGSIRQIAIIMCTPISSQVIRAVSKHSVPAQWQHSLLAQEWHPDLNRLVLKGG